MPANVNSLVAGRYCYPLAQPVSMLLQVSQIKLRVRNVRRLQLVFFQRIYEVTEPRHAPPRFRTHVETSAAPSKQVYATLRSNATSHTQTAHQKSG
jgi:hypothetical protein